MMGKHIVEDFRIPPGKRVRLNDFDPAFKGKHGKSHGLRSGSISTD